jgi:hypothetical protein
MIAILLAFKVSVMAAIPNSLLITTFRLCEWCGCSSPTFLTGSSSLEDGLTLLWPVNFIATTF